MMESRREDEEKGKILSAVAGIGILPVIAVPSAEAAVPLADALVDGGVTALEVTLRSACALEAIVRIRRAHPEMVLGAGTILDRQQAVAARDAGVDFLVAPGLDPEIVAAARELGLPFVPGVSNPSEITLAVKLGLKTLKFFPAEISGGVAALTLYHGPFPDVAFVPTGGMSFDNIGTYLKKPFVAACGGSYMAKSEDVRAADWKKITANCRRCVEIVREARA